MLKRHSVATGTPVSEQRRSSPKQARIKSWWLRFLLVFLTGVVGWQAWRLLVAGHQLNPYFSQLSHETVHWSWRKPTCPLEYTRHQWSDIQAGRKRPYLFGGQQEPECTNCEVDALWSHFCQFKSHVGGHHPRVVHLHILSLTGPVCAEWEQKKVIKHMVDRAKAHAPGMEEMLTLTPCDLWPWLRGRTLWLVGDSMMQQMTKAAICFMYEFWDLDIKSLDNVTKAVGLYQDYLGEFCIEMPEDSRICHIRVNTVGNLTQRVLPNFRKFTGKTSDVIVVNVGIWYSVPSQYSTDMAQFADYYSAHKHELPYILWRDTAAQHFATPTGEFGLRLTIPFVCKPLNVTLQDDNTLIPQEQCDIAAAQEIRQGGFRNRIANPIISSLGIPVIHTWNLSVPLWEYYHHVAEKGDCTHSCHPSGYQVWLYQLHAAMVDVAGDLQRHMLATRNTSRLPVS